MQKRKLTSDKRRELTVDTVIELSAKGDPANITTDNIAKHMHVTQGALFRHFANKEAIWETVIDTIAERLMQRFEHATNIAETPLSALQAIFYAHIDFITEYPGVPPLIVSQLQLTNQTPAKRKVHTLLSAYRKRVESLLTEAQTSGDLDEYLDIEAAAIQFIGTIQGLVVQSLIIGNIEHMVELAQRVFQLYLHGIKNNHSEQV